MRILSRIAAQHHDLIWRKLEILAYGNQHLVYQALSCNVQGRQRTLAGCR